MRGISLVIARAKRRYFVLGLMAVPAIAAAVALAGGGLNRVHPTVFDPQSTDLVAAAWVNGIGCPTDVGSTHWSDGACASGDPADGHNEGLLLDDSIENPPAQPVPLPIAEADLKGVKGIELTELGFDIRSPGLGWGTYPPGPSAYSSDCSTDPETTRPSGIPVCFLVTLKDGSGYYAPCATVGVWYSGYWTRFRCPAPILAYNIGTGAPEVISGRPVQTIQIQMHDNINGLVILDNIDINGTMIGQG